MIWIFVRIASERDDSNKYPKHMFYEEIIIKQGLSYISICPVRIIYNRKFILMATSLETNAVVVTRVHCIEVGMIHLADFPHVLERRQFCDLVSFPAYQVPSEKGLL